jgi:hypothetical protein
MDHGESALETKGFFKSLYDFKFESFVAMRMLRILYIIITILYSLGAIVFLITALASGKAGTIIIGLILIPIGYIIYLAFARIAIEVIMVIFRIGAEVQVIAERSAGGGNSTSD